MSEDITDRKGVEGITDGNNGDCKGHTQRSCVLSSGS